MSDGMRVDLSAMDEVIRRLWRLLDDMEKAGTTSKYSTEIPMDAFGQTCYFTEAGALHGAQGDMKDKIEKIIKRLHELIDDFGTKTSQVRDKYNDKEHEIKTSVGGDSGGSTKNQLAQ